jgi:hypothetical protein
MTPTPSASPTPSLGPGEQSYPNGWGSESTISFNTDGFIEINGIDKWKDIFYDEDKTINNGTSYTRTHQVEGKKEDDTILENDTDNRYNIIRSLQIHVKGDVTCYTTDNIVTPLDNNTLYTVWASIGQKPSFGVNPNPNQDGVTKTDAGFLYIKEENGNSIIMISNLNIEIDATMKCVFNGLRVVNSVGNTGVIKFTVNDEILYDDDTFVATTSVFRSKYTADSYKSKHDGNKYVITNIDPNPNSTNSGLKLKFPLDTGDHLILPKIE